VRVLIAPDSFKGSVTAVRAAECIALGWLEVRPDDDVVILPMADGGEGTLDAIEAGTSGAQRLSTPVDGPRGATTAAWLLLPDGTAIAELAVACGLPLWRHPEPIAAHTKALGQVLAAAVGHPHVERLVLAVGGSASTDGGTGALAALGVSFTLDDRQSMPLGAGSLHRLAAVDLTHLLPPPPGGVEILTDVRAPLLGPDGAAAQFGPQKGASPTQVADLERGLTRLADVLGGHPQAAGAGAAGGTAYGLATVWGARLVPGSARVADLVGLDTALGTADLVITGEGRLDAQSFKGKVIGEVVHRADGHRVPVALCVGAAECDVATGLTTVELTAMAGSVEAAQRDAERWLETAGRELARGAS
jgi:glycerate kinase